MAIQIGGTTTIDDSRNIVGGIGTFTGLNIDVLPATYSPSIGATNVNVDTNIVLTFNQLIEKGTGNITIREGSSDGVAIQTIGVTSTSVTTSGFQVTIDPPSNLGFSTTYYPVIDEGAFKNGFGNISTAITTYSFITQTSPLVVASLGDTIEGGELICKSVGTAWILAPSSSQVGRTWYCRNDAVTTAQQVSGCTGWFVPSCSQLQNPGYLCRQYWDSYASTCYWSSTEYNSSLAWRVDFTDGVEWVNPDKTGTLCVRAFRCVTY
jgi:hypothetical protein